MVAGELSVAREGDDFSFLCGNLASRKYPINARTIGLDRLEAVERISLINAASQRKIASSLPG